jgi:hypothetical protein
MEEATASVRALTARSRAATPDCPVTWTSFPALKPLIEAWTNLSWLGPKNGQSACSMGSASSAALTPSKAKAETPKNIANDRFVSIPAALLDLALDVPFNCMLTT